MSELLDDMYIANDANHFPSHHVGDFYNLPLSTHNPLTEIEKHTKITPTTIFGKYGIDFDGVNGNNVSVYKDAYGNLFFTVIDNSVRIKLDGNEEVVATVLPFTTRASDRQGGFYLEDIHLENKGITTSPYATVKFDPLYSREELYRSNTKHNDGERNYGLASMWEQKKDLASILTTIDTDSGVDLFTSGIEKYWRLN